MNFYLTRNQLKHLNEWVESKPKLYSGAIGGRYSYHFILPFKFGSKVYVKDWMSNLDPTFDLACFVEESEASKIKDGTCEDGMNIQFSNSDYEKCLAWMEDRMKDGNRVDGRFEISIGYTSLGRIDQIHDMASSDDAKLDLTDYDDW